MKFTLKDTMKGIVKDLKQHGAFGSTSAIDRSPMCANIGRNVLLSHQPMLEHRDQFHHVGPASDRHRRPPSPPSSMSVTSTAQLLDVGPEVPPQAPKKPCSATV